MIIVQQNSISLLGRSQAGGGPRNFILFFF